MHAIIRCRLRGRGHFIVRYICTSKERFTLKTFGRRMRAKTDPRLVSKMNDKTRSKAKSGKKIIDVS